MRKSTGRSSRATVCAPTALALPTAPSSDRPTTVAAPAPGESAHPGHRHRTVHLTGDRAGRNPVVVAYRNAREPLCGVARRDGFRRPNANRRTLSTSRKGLWIPRPRDSRPLDSGPGDFGRSAAARPAYRNTAGGHSAVFGPGPALRSGGVRPQFRFTIRAEGYPLGALFVRTGSAR